MAVLHQAVMLGLAGYVPDNVDRIPTMTGATTSGVTASASGGSGDAWRTGDNNTGTEWNSGAAGSYWLKYDFGAPKDIASYVVQGPATTTDAPKQWTFEGSNDNTNWDVLDTQGPLTWTSLQSRVFNLGGLLPKQYQYYRWNGLSGQGGGNWCRISEVELRS